MQRVQFFIHSYSYAIHFWTGCANSLIKCHIWWHFYFCDTSLILKFSNPHIHETWWQIYRSLKSSACGSCSVLNVNLQTEDTSQSINQTFWELFHKLWYLLRYRPRPKFVCNLAWLSLHLSWTNLTWNSRNNKKVVENDPNYNSNFPSQIITFFYII